MSELPQIAMSARELFLIERLDERYRARTVAVIEGLREAHVRDTTIAHGLERAARQAGMDLLGVLRDEGLISSEQESRISAKLRGDARFFERSIVDVIDVARIQKACGEYGIDLRDRRAFMPVELTDSKLDGRSRLTVVVSRDRDRADAAQLFGSTYEVELAYASEKTIKSIYQSCFAETEQALVVALRAFESQMSANVGEGIDQVIVQMLRHGSFTGVSDIALKVVGSWGTINVKVGGVWRRIAECSMAAYDRIVRAIEMACDGNDSGQREIFRDTAFNRTKGLLTAALTSELSAYQYRLAIGRALSGTSVTIRILDEGTEVLDLSAVGILDDDLINLRAIAQRRSGLFAVVGPTGSGKTTFLHAFMKDSIDTLNAYVQTAERPVEYRIHNASQYPLDLAMEESAALEQVRRGLMRNAPNVILLGEVRTVEAANYALDFSTTGHLLVTTLHADSATMGVRRFLKLGLDPVDLAAQLLGVMAMRLVDQLCPDCKIPEDRAEYAYWRDEGATAASGSLRDLYQRNPGGCANCHFVGYRGRFAIYELMLGTSAVQEVIIEGGSERDLRKAGIAPGRSLIDSAKRSLWAGTIGVDELLRAMPASLGWRK